MGYALEGRIKASPNGTQRGSLDSEGVSDETAEIATPIITTREGGKGKEDTGDERQRYEEEQLERPRLLAAFEDSPRTVTRTLDEADHSGSSGETATPGEC